MCEHIVNRMSDVGVANLATRHPPVSNAPGRGGSKPPAAAQPLNIQRTAQLRQLREAKSLPYRAWAYELRYHHLQIVFSRNCRAAHPPVFLLICPHRGAEVLDVKNRI